MALEAPIDPVAPEIDEPSPRPLCLGCLQPHDPLLHYCPNCGAAVGQFTPNIPFVNIRFQCEFWGRLWEQLWSPQDGDYFVRMLGVVLIVYCVPIMLLGIPFVIVNRRRIGNRRGFEVLADSGDTTGSSPLQASPESVEDWRPDYTDRPPFDPG